MPTPKEAFFPVTYRAAQVQAIMDAVARRRSIAVYGLAGMGKSNLLRFLASHLRLKAHYLKEQAEQFQFVSVDCNLSDAHTADGLLRELDFQLERGGLALDRAVSTNLAPRQAIRLRLEATDPAHVIVLLVDPLDAAFAQFEHSFWAYLRGLRDVQGNVVYVLGARRPPPPLRELQELLTEACWVTPLTRQDALDSLARDAKRLRTAFAPRDRALLIGLSGGHPGLLKNCAELAGRGTVSLRQPVETVTRAFLACETIQEVCRDLWSDLSMEWKTLQGLALNVSPVSADDRALDFLQRAGVIHTTRVAYEIVSPLLRAYIVSNLPRVIHVRVGASGEVMLESWQGAQRLKVGDSAFRLLRAFAQQPTQIQTRAQLARVLALGDPHYSDEAVMAHVKRLRKILNDALRPLIGTEHFSAIVPARKQGYRLQCDVNDRRIEYHGVEP
jgi:hypothetical protein